MTDNFQQQKINISTYTKKHPCAPVIGRTKEPHLIEKSGKQERHPRHCTFIYIILNCKFDKYHVPISVDIIYSINNRTKYTHIHVLNTV